MLFHLKPIRITDLISIQDAGTPTGASLPLLPQQAMC